MSGYKLRSLSLLVPAGVLLLSSSKIWNWMSENVSITVRPTGPPIVEIPSVMPSYMQSYVPFKSAAKTRLGENYTCLNEYSVELLSVDPLVMYLNNFVRDNEIDHLLNSAQNAYEPSLVEVVDDGEQTHRQELNKTWRDANTAHIATTDPVARCLSRRLRALLGNYQHRYTEPLQLVKYEISQRFRMHHDRSYKNHIMGRKDGSTKEYNRLVSTFTYLDDNCTGGETYFPGIKGVGLNADGEKYARTKTDMGLVVKPKKGNTILWFNVYPNETIDERVYHAGLPIHSGTKIGMNLWSLHFPDKPALASDDPPVDFKLEE